MRLGASLVLYACYIWTPTVLMSDGINWGDDSKPNDDKILGGRYVLRKEDFPYMISMMRIAKERLHCSGSLLNPFYVVTACHCVVTLTMEDPVPTKLNYADFQFVAGTISLQGQNMKTAQIRKAKELAYHPQCRMAAHRWIDHNIGLAEMAEPFEINIAVKPINLFSLNSTEYDHHVEAIKEQKNKPFCTIAGYRQKMKQLMAIRTYPYPSKKCLQEYLHKGYNPFGNDTRMLCIVGDYGAGLNKYDTGAAWVCEGYMMGVYTLVINGLPVVCQKFSAGLDWLRKARVCGPDSGCKIPNEPPCGEFCEHLKNEVLGGASHSREEHKLILWSILVLIDR